MSAEFLTGTVFQKVESFPFPQCIILDLHYEAVLCFPKDGRKGRREEEHGERDNVRVMEGENSERRQ